MNQHCSFIMKSVSILNLLVEKDYFVGQLESGIYGREREIKSLK